jgi:hypothetical protein
MGMAFLGIILMIQGFGGLIVKYFFDRDFGLLHRIFEGGALTVASVVLGLLGLAMLLFTVSSENKQT